MQEIISRKIKSVLVVSAILSGFFLLLEPWMVIPVLIYAFIGCAVYGLPVSFLSDFVTKKIGKYRFVVASLIYSVFGFLPFLLLGELGVYAVVCSLLFFLSEEWQRARGNGRGLKTANRMIFMNALSTTLLFSLAAWGSMLTPNSLFEEHTNELYLIPKGYEGEVRVVYDVEDAPRPEKSEDFDVYRVNDKGYTLSPLPESEGVIHNQYYYMDAEGNKEKIDDSCINHGGTDGVETDDYEYFTSYFFVTQTQCGDTFGENGVPPDMPRGISLDQIIDEEGLNKLAY
ncbi:DUF6843 domain-containing protein [Peribacillus sp. NPDC097198]|uniref:DUF6843 domain-containing protein n=1 Tax=Peribacillus sp. NPDC097198 TaxID=3364397 RepID=UPI0038244DC2